MKFYNKFSYVKLCYVFSTNKYFEFVINNTDAAVARIWIIQFLVSNINVALFALNVDGKQAGDRWKRNRNKQRDCLLKNSFHAVSAHESHILFCSLYNSVICLFRTLKGHIFQQLSDSQSRCIYMYMYILL